MDGPFGGAAEDVLWIGGNQFNSSRLLISSIEACIKWRVKIMKILLAEHCDLLTLMEPNHCSSGVKQQ